MSTVIFDGPGEMPELNRITAKKNYASSSQSHKMGATAMFNDILHHLSEEKYPDLLNEVGGNVSVRQHPVYAFQKELEFGTTDRYSYKFIGLFTVGPDKGDKGYFKFTDSAVKNVAIRLEGTDHLKGVGFNYPWVVNGLNRITYNASAESLCIITGSDTSKWTAILEQSLCGTAKTESEINNYLESKFKPAYECAYNNNPLILGLDSTQISLDQINSDIDLFNTYRYQCEDGSTYKDILDSRQYSYFEFWFDGEYDLYYLDQETNKYEKNGINLQRDLNISDSELEGKTLNQKNELFISKRVERFKNEAPNHFNINDSLFQLAFLYIICASDNGEKNMYPYYLGKLWRFLQDDLDSIFSTDNQGQDTKPYSSELHDFTDSTKNAYIFKGEDSTFWLLIELAFEDRLKIMGRDILQAMYELSTKGTTTPDKLMGFFDNYFFDRAQNYFTKSAYNHDTEYTYEEAWNNKDYVKGVDIHPLAQALGGHESTERAWLEKRIVYLMSKYGFGGYSSYEDTALGIISLRTQVKQGFTLTPAIDMYPAILGGQSEISSATRRIKAGEPVQLAPVGGGNTNTYIVGTDWLTDIGDLKDLQIDPSMDVELKVGSKRLRRLKIGDENSASSKLATLTVFQCDSLEEVDARNLTNLTNNVDLSKCPRLIKAFFKGTNITGVTLADGSKIEYLQLPSSITKLALQNTKFLSTLDIGSYNNIGTLRLDNVPILNGFEVLKTIYHTEGQKLKDIRLVGFEYNSGTLDDVQMLVDISNDLDKYGNKHDYNGIDNSGTPTSGNPVIEGILMVPYAYQDQIDDIQLRYPGLTLKVIDGIYIRFVDPEWQELVITNYSTDKIGITQEDLDKVTSISESKFYNNLDITDLSDFNKFRKLNRLYSSTFKNCSNLKTVTLPDSVTRLDGYNFQYCTSLESIIIPDSVTSLSNGVVEGCTSLTSAIIGNKVPVLNESAFKGCSKLESITIPNSVTSIGRWAFSGCSSLKSITIPNSVTSLGITAFSGCTSFTSITIPGSVTSIGSDTFSGCTSLTNVTFEDGLKELSLRMFNGCTKISEIRFCNTIKTISSQCFTNITLTHDLVIPDSVKTLTEWAFQNVTCPRLFINLTGKNLNTTDTHLNYRQPIVLNANEIHIDSLYEALKSTISWWYNTHSIWDLYENGEKLVDIIIPHHPIARIPGYIFAYSSIETVKISDGTTLVGGSSFNNCTKLSKVYIPSSLNISNESSFQGCSSLNGVHINDIAAWSGIQFKNDTSNPLYYAKNLYLDNELITNLDLPEDIYSVSPYSFINATCFTNIKIPSTVTSIGKYAFNGCTNAQIDLSKNNSLGVIGERAFYGCKAQRMVLTQVYSLGERAFYTSSITTMIIDSPNITSIPQQLLWLGKTVRLLLPENIASIGPQSLEMTNRNLKCLVIKNPIPPEVGSLALRYMDGFVYVLDDAIDTYLSNEFWNGYGDRIRGITTLFKYDFDSYVEFAPYLIGYTDDLYISVENILQPNSTNVRDITTYYRGSIVTPEYSLNSDIAVIEGNILVFNEVGSVELTVTYNGLSKTVEVYYQPILVKKGVVYKTNLTIGSKFNYTEHILNDEEKLVWESWVVDTTNFSSITITGAGGIAPRLYCFIDSDGNVLSVAGELLTLTNTTIQIPTNATTCILNFNTSKAVPSVILNK